MEAIPTTERLKITLDLIANIPNFDGNTSYFLDSLAPIFATFHPNVSVIITNYIRDKIVGRARLELQKHGRLDNWDEMKEVLKNRFGEKASVHSLVDQIRTARVDTTIEAFYNKISYLLSRANNSYLLNNNENNTELINSNKRIALEAFKNNLPEPTGTIVLSRNPETLNDAYKIISEINHHYTDYSNCRTQNVSNNFFRSSYNQEPHTYNRNNYNRIQQQRQETRFFNDSGSNNHVQQGNNEPNNNNETQNHRFTRPNNNSFQSVQTHRSSNFTNSSQSRQRINYRQDNNDKPMDITLSENQHRNFPRRQQNFRRNQRNSYPI